MFGRSSASVEVTRYASIISTAVASVVRRSPIANTFASCQQRAPSAVSRSVQSAARTPATLFAAIETPVPVQHITMPNSARPSATDSPTDRPTIGQVSSRRTSTNSWPCPTRWASIASVAPPRSNGFH